jgi:hypothetical protein
MESLQGRDLRKRSLNFHLFSVQKQTDYEVAVIDERNRRLIRCQEPRNIHEALSALRETQHSSESPNADPHKILKFLEARITDVPYSYYPILIKYICSGNFRHTQAVNVFRTVASRIVSCQAARSHVLSDFECLVSLRCRLESDQSTVDIEQLKQLDSAVFNTLQKEGRRDGFSPSFIGAVFEYIECCRIPTRQNRILCSILRLRLMDGMRSSMKKADSRTIHFSLLSGEENHVTVQSLIPLLIRYLRLISSGGKSGNMRSEYKLFNERLCDLVTRHTNVISLPRIMEIASVHSSLGFRNLRSHGHKALHEWIRSRKHLSVCQTSDLRTALECAMNTGFTQKFNMRRLRAACEIHGIQSPDHLDLRTSGRFFRKVRGKDQLLRMFTSRLSHGIVPHRFYRRALHINMRHVRVGRLSKEEVTAFVSNLKTCNKRDCQICMRFRRELDLAIAFHFPSL